MNPVPMIYGSLFGDREEGAGCRVQDAGIWEKGCKSGL